MASAPVLRNAAREAEVRVVPPHSVTVGMGVLWIVGAAAAWNVVLVFFHNLMTRLLR